MRYLSIIIIALLLTSCCATKKVASTKDISIKTNINPEDKKDEIVKINDSIYYLKNSKFTTTEKVNDSIKYSLYQKKATNYNGENIEIDEPKPQDTTPQIPLPPKPPTPTKAETTEAFNHIRFDRLLKENVSENGNVNYQKFRNDPTELTVYIDDLTHNLPTDDWSKEDKLAYWINAYNALTIDLILRNYPVKSIKDIKDPWDQRLWQFGDKWYNLNQIEHQILRKMDEPRIHFAIVCASFSCPKLQNEAFTASNLESQLTAATSDFLEDSNRNNISTNTLQLSKIFKWFSKDFKTEGNIQNFIDKHSSINVSNKAKISYKDYNWDLND